jgi:hypothetical protein
MTRLVADEVWARLDPMAGQLVPRAVRRLRLAATIAAALAVVLAALWWSGLVVPRVSIVKSSGFAYSVEPTVVTHQVPIVNLGRRPVDVLGVGRSGPGMRLDAVRGAVPTTLHPGESLTVTLVYRVTDCAAVPADPWPVPVQVKWPWGRYTAYLALPTHTSPDAPDDMRSFTGRDPYAVEWQRALADLACKGG